MKHNYFIISVLFFQSITFICIGQNYKPGYYTSISGDTLKGWLTVPDNNPPYNFSFANHPDSPATKVAIAACKNIMAGEQSFIICQGHRTVSYIDKIDQSIVNIDSGITEVIPLRLIYSGKRVSMYHFNNPTDYFFIKTGDTIQQLFHLYNNVSGWARMNYRLNRPSYEENKIFRNQLVGLFGADITNKQMNWIEATEYDENSLKKFLKKFDL